jgi:hypothetical protein
MSAIRRRGNDQQVPRCGVSLDEPMESRAIQP